MNGVLLGKTGIILGKPCTEASYFIVSEAFVLPLFGVNVVSSQKGSTDGWGTSIEALYFFSTVDVKTTMIFTSSQLITLTRFSSRSSKRL